MTSSSGPSNLSFLNKGSTGPWMDLFRTGIENQSEGLPEIILILSLICTVGGRCKFLYLSLYFGYVL